MDLSHLRCGNDVEPLVDEGDERVRQVGDEEEHDGVDESAERCCDAKAVIRYHGQRRRCAARSVGERKGKHANV